MIITHLPLAPDLKVIDNGDTFAIKLASGAVFGSCAKPQNPWLLSHDDPISAPVCTWAAQKSLEAYAEFDAGMTNLNRDDSVSDIERARRRLKLVEKAQSALEHIEHAFAAEEADAKALEAALYSWPPLQDGDFIGAMRETEIRAGLRAMPDKEIAELMRRMNDGEDRSIIEAILRSPLKMGRVDQFAQNGWRVLQDRQNPERRAGLNTRAAQNDWGRRITGMVQGALGAKLRAASKFAAA